MILRPRILLPQPPDPNYLKFSLTTVGTRHTHPRRQWHSCRSATTPHRSSPLRPVSHRHHDTASTPRTTHPFLPRRPFSSTTSHPAPTENHYEILGLEPSADAATLKKRFYTLSRQHHPDLHPTDPSAVQRFQQISESYSILSDPQKRARYDRDVLRLHHHHRTPSRSTPGGTYAGSRPPSGLSKRRSAVFRGPPPSYFAQGGGGSYQAGRNPYTRGPDGEATVNDNSNNYTYARGAYGLENPESAAEFDSRGVYRTQTHEDRKRNARRAAAMAAAQAAAEEDGDFWARFVIISCTLLGGLMIASLFVTGDSGGRKGGMVRSDGTRREVREKG